MMIQDKMRNILKKKKNESSAQNATNAKRSQTKRTAYLPLEASRASKHQKVYIQQEENQIQSSSGKIMQLTVFNLTSNAVLLDVY